MIQRTCTVPATARTFFMENIVTGTASRAELQQFERDCDYIMRFRPTPAQHAELLYFQAYTLHLLSEHHDEVRFQAQVAAKMAKEHHVLYAYVASTLLALTYLGVSSAERYERLHEGVSREMEVLDRDTWRCSDKEYQAAYDLVTAAYEDPYFAR